MMNRYREEKPYCCFHPKEVIVGICALCLKERLLILASKQRHSPSAKDTSRPYKLLHRKPSIILPKVFALGSFLHRLEFRHRKSNDIDVDTLSSHEDSFISIKFEGNGRASWDNATSSKPSMEALPCNHTKKTEGTRSVVEHAKTRPTLRWRKRIGHLFQLVRWKRSNKGNACHVGSKMEGVKVRKIRSLTKERTME